MPDDDVVNKAYQKYFVGRRSRGWPPKHWKDGINKGMGMQLLTAERIAKE